MKQAHVIIRYAWFEDDRRGGYCGVLEWLERYGRQGFSGLGFNTSAPEREWAEFDSEADALDALGPDRDHPHMHHEVIEKRWLDRRHVTRYGFRNHYHMYQPELHLIYTATA